MIFDGSAREWFLRIRFYSLHYALVTYHWEPNLRSWSRTFRSSWWCFEKWRFSNCAQKRCFLESICIFHPCGSFEFHFWWSAIFWFCQPSDFSLATRKRLRCCLHVWLYYFWWELNMGSPNKLNCSDTLRNGTFQWES